jgi:hypothetical protein
VSSYRVPVLGVFVVGVINWSGEGVGPKSLKNECSICRMSNPCNGCPPLPFIDARGGAQGKENTSYSAWLLGCPFVRRCLSGRIEAEACGLVVGALAWLVMAVHLETLGVPSE